MRINTEDRTIEVMHSEWYRNMFKCYSDIAIETFNFFVNKKKFYAATLPITTESISSPMGLGSDSLPVRVNLLGKETYLADSMQFLLEYSLRFENSGVFYLMPTFRGEDTDERHLSQFYHAESEIIGDLSDVMFLCEEYVKFLSKKIIQKDYYQNAVSKEKFEEVKLISELDTFPRIRFDEAINLLKKDSLEHYIEYIDDIPVINSKGEKYLMKKFKGIVWLTHFEHKSVPFYQAYDNNDKRYALAADLLVGVGETIGCGQRANYPDVIRSLEDHEVNINEYKWYIDMKREKPLITSGFGMGVERFIAWLFDVNDIRTIPYVYRDKKIKIIP